MKRRPPRGSLRFFPNMWIISSSCNMKITLIIFFMAILVTVSPVMGAEKEKEDSIRVLFIGNSYTYYHDLPDMIKQIAARAGMHEKMKVLATSFTPGGSTFRRHLENPELLETLRKGGWDFVVLQEQSTAPAMQTESVARNVYPYAARLDSLARAGSKDVKVVYYMTWGHKDGYRNPAAPYPLAETYEGMQERLKTSYIEMAHASGGICAPVGLAWEKVREERPYESLYWPDRSHPSKLGTYLAANVIYAVMLGRPYQSYWTADFNPELAEYIQQVAQQTVFHNRRLLGISDPVTYPKK